MMMAEEKVGINKTKRKRENTVQSDNSDDNINNDLGRQNNCCNTDDDDEKKRRAKQQDSSSQIDESTTIDDLSAMDASTYLAWVNRQAESLPKVFVAAKGNGSSILSTHNTLTVSITNDAPTVEKNEKEAPINGSMATVQVLLSKRMEIYPPPSVRHLPPNDVSNSDLVFSEDCNELAAKSELAEAVSVNKDDNKELPPINSSSTTTTKAWISTTISNFSNLRTNLEREHAKIKQSSSNNINLIRKIAVPKMKDRASWHIFCLGKDEAYGNVGGYYEEVDGNNGDVDKDAAAQKQQQHLPTATSSYNPNLIPSHGYKPTTSLLLQFDQVLTRKLFHHHVQYLCEWKCSLTKQRALWIYALLGNMEKPWHREECCGVRKVLRECCDRRWRLVLPPSTDIGEVTLGSTGNGKDGKEKAAATTDTTKAATSCWEELALLNTLIAITGIYYEQGSHASGDGYDSLFSVRATAKTASSTTLAAAVAVPEK